MRKVFASRILHMLNEMRSNKTVQFIMFISISIIIACLSHTFFISEWFAGKYMLGMNDGLSQMLPFKQLLYDGYASGNFFYSNQFGMGGGTYSQLGYYFSNSIFFLITAGITFLLEKMNVIEKPNLIYWADLILIISVVRMTLIIVVTTIYFRYININVKYAYIGAVIYSTSIIYFRHVAYWEFFADAMLWLPLLLMGIEKIIREKKLSLFIASVAISLFDNFYFAYINFLLASMYILFRFFIPLFSKETNKIHQVKLFILSGLAGFGISAVSFIPIVYGYLHNHRIPFQGTAPIFGVTDSLLLDSKIVVLPTFALVCLFIKPYYKNYLFRLFACLTILSILLHFSPLVASIFNGFSAPQYRWEYFLSLMASGVIATGLQHIKNVTRRQVVLSVAWIVVVYAVSYVGLKTYYYLVKKQWSIFSLQNSYLAIAAIVTIVLFILYHFYKRRLLFHIFCISLIVIAIYTSNIYQMIKLSGEGSANASQQVMNSDKYNGKDQRELIEQIKQREHDSFYRIDWMIGTRNNTPIVQDFHGFSVYSSILNKHLLYFYLYDLEIDMGRESASRYMTLGDRANLHSLLRGKYYITDEKKAIPSGFEKVLSVGNYIAYENKNILPFFRPTSIVFMEKDLERAPVTAKERAMLEGVILTTGSTTNKKIPIPESLNVIQDVQIYAKDAVYAEGQLHVMENIGGIDVVLNDQALSKNDFYVSFYLERFDQDKGYTLKVNDYVTTRKKNTSIYKTGVNKITIRVPNRERISIRVPKGKYKLTDLELYEEDYDYLHRAKKESLRIPEVPVYWSGNKVTLIYDNKENDHFATVPIPFEKGWTLRMNGQRVDVLRANYAFIGFPLKKGINHIELVYYPPYFFLSLFITIVSIIILLLVKVKGKGKEEIKGF